MRTLFSTQIRFIFLITTLAFSALLPPAYANDTYICPMHPHIHGEEGDKCPICGMDLVAQPSEEHSTMQNTHQKALGNNAHDMSGHENAVSMEEKIYICPMHPHIKGEEGDSCPICGMDLVLQENNSDVMNASNTSELRNSISIHPHLVQSLGVRVSEVGQHNFGLHIRAFGKIVPNMRNEYDVDAHSRGRISKLMVNAVGDKVKKGDLLYTYYSPDLITAQSDYLIGAQSKSTLNKAEQRLRLFGMDKESIALLKKKKTFIEEVPFHAPANGTVTALNIRQGSHLDAGERVMTISDFSSIWIMADVPLKDLAFLKVGDKATVVVPETGLSIDTAIDFIYPINNPSTRTAQIRIELDNKNGEIRPDTYVDIDFESSPENRLAVPEDAVLYSSAGAYVFIELEAGVFQAIKIKPGITSEGYTEILAGLTPNQRVVISGQFMIDGESKIRGVDLSHSKSDTSTPHHH